VEFGNLKDGPSYNTLGGKHNNPSERIWVLVDSDEYLLEPAQVFGDGCFFIVETASLCSACLQDPLISCFYMTPPSFTEVLQM